MMCIFCHLSLANNLPALQLQNGNIDLTSWDFNQDIVKLNGDAIFYWEKLILPTDIAEHANKSAIVNLATGWDKRSVNRKSFDTNGFGTYHLHIIIPEEYVGKEFILRPSQYISYASQVIVNGKVVAQNGSIGQSKTSNSYTSGRKIMVTPFIADCTELNIVIWASNFSNLKGGITSNMELGLRAQMLAKREYNVVIDLIIMACLFAMCIYHLILFFINIENKVALYFSIMCLNLVFEFSFQNAMTFFVLFPDISFNYLFPFQVSFHYLIPPTFFLFFHALYPKEVSKLLRNIVILISILIISIIFFRNSSIYNHFFKLHLIYVFALSVYILQASIKVLFNKRFGIKLFLLAFIILVICGINDVLNYYGIIESQSLFSPGFIAFVFFLSYLQGKKHEEVYKNNLKLNLELRALNTSLENKVIDRTKALSTAIDKLNTNNEKLIKLAAFKEDMTNMIIHDLKSPLNTVINVKHLNNKLGINLVQQSGYTILNLVQNILSVHQNENTKIKLNLSNVRLPKIISESTEEVIFLAKQKTLSIDYDKRCEHIIKVDNEIVRRIFVNLLSNATKYAPTGSTIYISDTIKQNILTVSISNSGPQIPKDKQNLIFEKYTQNTKENLGQTSSNGLGLAFCKMAVEAHGGQIWVESTPAHTYFHFNLPLAPIENEKDSTSVKQKAKQLNQINFSQTEITYLSPISLKLNKFRIHQTSQLRKNIQQITPVTENIKYWKEELGTAVYSCDSKMFSQLIKMITEY